MEKSKSSLKGVLMLLMTAFIWGSAFVAQSIGSGTVEPFTFSGIRTLMGAAVLLPVIIMSNHRKLAAVSDAQAAEIRACNLRSVKAGIPVGIVFCIANNLQQFAFPHSDPGKIAFITALYIFFVPLFSLFLYKKKVRKLTWLCVAMGFTGLYFLSIDPADAGSLNIGDVLSFFCAIAFAGHILIVERTSSGTDGVILSCVQFAVSGTVSCILMLIFEHPRLSAIGSAIIPLLYAGVLSCGLGYTFQIIGQKYTEATIASLVLCMESVFAVLTSALVLRQIPSAREALGCIIMFAAIIIAQIPDLIAARKKA